MKVFQMASEGLQICRDLKTMKEPRRGKDKAACGIIVSNSALIRRKENGLLMETPTSRLMHM